MLQGALEWESWSSESAPVATGASLEEAEACIREAINFHLDGLGQDGMPIPLPSSHVEYLELVDWAGRAIRADKRGAIPSLIPPILNWLGVDPGRYLHHMGGKSKLTQHITAIGPLDRLQALAKKMGQSFLKGNGLARQLYRARH